MKEIRLNDVGVRIKATIYDLDGNVVDLSSYTTLTFNFEKPDGSIIPKTASLSTDGMDGQVEYITESGVIDQIGIWNFQVYVVLGVNSYSSTETRFRVTRKLS